jgi:hypothetical protein
LGNGLVDEWIDGFGATDGRVVRIRKFFFFFTPKSLKTAPIIAKINHLRLQIRRRLGDEERSRPSRNVAEVSRPNCGGETKLPHAFPLFMLTFYHVSIAWKNLR